MQPLKLSDGREIQVPQESSRDKSRAGVRAELEKMMELIQGGNRIRLTGLMNSEGFWEAPASTKEEYHGAWPGGLADHTLSLVRHMAAMDEAWECGLDPGQMVLVGILHDIAKAGVDGKPYYLAQESKWHQDKLGQKYKYNDSLPAMGQNTMSLYLAQKHGIILSTDEYQAIMGQDGLFSNEGKSVWESRRKPCKLAFVLHFSDWYTSAVHRV